MPAPEILERVTVIKRYSAARQLEAQRGHDALPFGGVSPHLDD
jgi:hypothetical protein